MKLGTVPAGKSGTFFFSPPGSSNLPVRIFWEGIRDERKVRPVSSQKAGEQQTGTWRARLKRRKAQAQQAESQKKVTRTTQESLLDRIDRTMTINEAN